jgi:hypothetical protein
VGDLFNAMLNNWMLLVMAVQYNTFPLQKERSQDSVVIIVTVLQAGRSMVRILAGARDFSVLQNVQTLWALFSGHNGSFLVTGKGVEGGGGVKWLGH